MAQAAAREGLMYDDNLAYNHYGTAVPQWEEPEVQPVPAEQPARRRRAGAAAKTQTKYGISVVGVLGFVLVVVLMLAVLLAHVRYTEAAASVVALQEQLEELDEQEKKLEIEYERAFDIHELEAYATDTLHMTRPTADQIYYMSGSSTDRGQILAAENEEQGPLSRMTEFLSSLLRYFKQ